MDFLATAVAALAIVNGLILISQWWNGRPFIVVQPIHPSEYQWWFRLPDKESEHGLARRFGFLCYVGIHNRGGRGTSFVRFRLHVKNQLGLAQHRDRVSELCSVNIPQPEFRIGGHLKKLAVLGQRTLDFDGSNFLESGKSTSGMACYLYQVFGDDSWNPKVNTDGSIDTQFTVRAVTGHAKGCHIRFHEKSLTEILDILPGAETMFSVDTSTNDSPPA